MRSNTRVTVQGPFVARELGLGRWRLGNDDPGAAEILIHGTEPGAAVILERGSIPAVALEWHAEGVRVAVTTHADGVRTLDAGSVLLHEPQPCLYESLPLAGFDAKAKRFWRRVFAIMRVPGGRFVLRFFTRRG
jgi:hypothetical protein